MKKENTLLYCIWVVLKYKTLSLIDTNIRCWFGHDYKDTNRPNISKCRKCGRSTLFIKAVYVDREDT